MASPYIQWDNVTVRRDRVLEVYYTRVNKDDNTLWKIALRTMDNEWSRECSYDIASSEYNFIVRQLHDVKDYKDYDDFKEHNEGHRFESNKNKIVGGNGG